MTDNINDYCPIFDTNITEETIINAINTHAEITDTVLPKLVEVIIPCLKHENIKNMHFAEIEVPSMIRMDKLIYRITDDFYSYDGLNVEVYLNKFNTFRSKIGTDDNNYKEFYIWYRKE